MLDGIQVAAMMESLPHHSMKTLSREELQETADQHFNWLAEELEKHGGECQCTYCLLSRSLLANYISQ